MNRPETEAYKHLKKVPAKLSKASSFEKVYRISENRFKEEHNRIERNESQIAPVYVPAGDAQDVPPIGEG